MELAHNYKCLLNSAQPSTCLVLLGNLYLALQAQIGPIFRMTDGDDLMCYIAMISRQMW